MTDERQVENKQQGEEMHNKGEVEQVVFIQQLQGSHEILQTDNGNDHYIPTNPQLRCYCVYVVFGNCKETRHFTSDHQ